MSKPSTSLRSSPLEITERPIETLIPYSGNARIHSRKKIAQLAASMRRFGLVAPVLIASDGVIIAGHARVEAASRHAPASETLDCGPALKWDPGLSPPTALN